MKQVRIGLIGVTGRGSLAKYWQEDPDGRAVVAAGMDVNTNALASFREKVNPEARVTTDVDELLAMNDLDAVAVMSPDFTHEAYVMKAFAAGKHVFCEKPMAISTEGCDRMLRAWQNAGTHFMIGFNMRYINIFRVMKEIVDAGTIGDVKAVWCRHFVGMGGAWYFHDWHASRRTATGLLLQKAAHDIDMIHWITGRYTRNVSGFGSLDVYGGDRSNDLRCPQCPDKEDCVEYHHEPDRPNPMDLCVYRDEVDVEDQSTILMELEGGIHATYMQCHYAPDYWRNYTFIGTEGRVENVDDDSKVIVKLRRRSKQWKNLADRTYDVAPAEGSHGGADPLVCRDFLDMVQKGTRPLSTPLAGRMSVATACAATASIRDGRRVVDVTPVDKDLREVVF